MKKLFLALVCVAVMATAVSATNTITASPSNSNISSTSGFFDVTFTLSTTVTNISSFDLFLQSSTLGVDSGNFTITVTTPSTPGTPADSPQNPDLISTSSTYGVGSTARNNHDQGFSYATDQTINNTFSLETLRITYNFASLPATGTTFTFATTPSNAGSDFGTNPDATPSTHFYSDDFGSLNTIDNAPTFTVTVTAVPEPSTWLTGIGALGVIAFTTLRRRQTT